MPQMFPISTLTLVLMIMMISIVCLVRVFWNSFFIKESTCNTSPTDKKSYIYFWPMY